MFSIIIDYTLKRYLYISHNVCERNRPILFVFTIIFNYCPTVLIILLMYFHHVYKKIKFT